MRTEQQIMDLVLTIAEQDKRIRAVGMNGSRTNPNAPKDIFQDFDIAYIVTEMDSFINDTTWIDIFGERIIMQTPENKSMFPPELGDRFTYLMLFTDGNRIDLTLIPIEKKDEYCREDKNLSEEKWQEVLSTYPNGSYESIWKALFAMCDLFRSTAIFVADNLDFNYPYEEDKKVNAYLIRVERLSPDGSEIY
ncbi:aminoglycoside 6-adenylyltransferase [Psychrobacillus sp. NPDC096426]|uniref:aminoglycoside 6-adenylyltransferase n=1 Tax=Psychrobacillus sp. NPDC096426 TaxID=3364491 RepID=UPI003801A571